MKEEVINKLSIAVINKIEKAKDIDETIKILKELKSTINVILKTPDVKKTRTVKKTID